MRTTHSTTHSRAFTLVELLVVVMVIGLTACLLLPALARGKKQVQRMQCVDNLKVIGLAFKVHNFDHSAKSPSSATNSSLRFPEEAAALAENPFAAFQVLSNSLESPQKLVCPSDSRTAATDFGTGFGPAHLSYFKNLNSDDTQAPLSGDRNLKTTSPPVRGIFIAGKGTVLGWTEEELHRNQGNIIISDGSVQQLTSSRLKAQFDASATPAKLAIP